MVGVKVISVFGALKIVLLLVKIFGQRKIYYRANNCVTNGFSFRLMSTLESPHEFEKRKSIFIFASFE